MAKQIVGRADGIVYGVSHIVVDCYTHIVVYKNQVVRLLRIYEPGVKVVGHCWREGGSCSCCVSVGLPRYLSEVSRQLSSGGRPRHEPGSLQVSTTRRVNFVLPNIIRTGMIK
jgi:hypothetical protein